MSLIRAVALFAVALLAPVCALGGNTANHPDPAPTATFPAAPPGSGPWTTNNDDSCDIGSTAGATLLVPWFEVDLDAKVSSAVTTTLSVSNLVNQPQIAHVVLWTDRGFPVLGFNLFLTGYDVVAISLYDVLVRGQIAPPGGTSNTSPSGSRSTSNLTGNPLFASTAATNCANVPSTVPPLLLAEVRNALTRGNFFDSTGVGNSHSLASGYVTIDVVNDCTSILPTDPLYHSTNLLFDNVLMGDIIRINPTTSSSHSAITGMIPIRAVPEGGAAGLNPGSNLPFTFYDRFTPAGTQKIDRRQPLPATFAARFLQPPSPGNGDANNDTRISVADVLLLIDFLFKGVGVPPAAADVNLDGAVTVADVFYLINFLFAGGPAPLPLAAPLPFPANTDLLIWREGTTGGSAPTSEYVANASMPFTEIVRFDEHENPSSIASSCSLSPCTPDTGLPVAGRISTRNTTIFPGLHAASGDSGGWIFLNLNQASGAFSTVRRSDGSHSGVSQNHVLVDTTSEGRYGTATDATSLENGCSPRRAVSSAVSTSAQAGNGNVDLQRFASGSPSTTGNDDSCDIGLYPAATLLLPYFEVDFTAPSGTALDTTFTITNVSPASQVVGVTVWTDRAFPVLTLNVFLTGYDIETISLYDLIARGLLPETSVNAPRGSRSLPNNQTGNPNLLPTVGIDCANLPSTISPALQAQVQSALTGGPWFQLTGVGNRHSNAIGYITMDVKNSCSQTLPTKPSYYTREILFDNVLTGEYSFTNPSTTTGNFRTGGNLVAIRAVPEGGPAGLPPAGARVNFPYTFYDRYTDSATLELDKADRRQPLPATFAARFVQAGAGSFNTSVILWREGRVGGAATEAGTVAADRNTPIAEVVRFDERENATTFAPPGPCQITCPPPLIPGSSIAQKASLSNTTVFPPAPASEDTGGWVYMNLNNQSNSTAYSHTRQAEGSHVGVSQNWVEIELVGEGRYGGALDATWLGNGCSRNPGVRSGSVPIGPAPNVTP